MTKIIEMYSIRTGNLMKARISKKLVVVGSLIAAVVIGAPVAAWAGTSYESYSVTIGSGGGNGYTGNQTKAGGSVKGDVNVTSVGNDYTVGASMMKSNGSQEGTKRYDLGAGYSATLPNSIAASSSVKMKMWGNPFWIVAIQANGTWKSQ